MSRFGKSIAFVFAASLLLLQSCGFHLRGGDGMNIPTVVVQGNASAFLVHLKNELKNTGVNVVALEREADWALVILGNQRSRRVMSVDEDGKAQEYELRQTVNFLVKDLKSGELKSRQEFTRTRDLLFDKTEVLGKDYEESLLYEDIEGDNVNAIIWRLRALATEEPSR